MLEGRVSRRDFLKLMGSGAIVISLGFLGITSFFERKGLFKASGASLGSWSSPFAQPDQTTTVHAALLASGKVIWIQGSGFHSAFKTGPFKHGIWNPDGSFGSVSTLADDLFCHGMSTLENGNVLLTGGTLAYDEDTLNGKFFGAKFAYEVDFSTGGLQKVSDMAHGRWYASNVTLPDGKVFVVQGWDEFGCQNRLVEIYDPSTKSFQIKLDPGNNITYCVGACATADYPQAGTPCYGPGASPFLSLYPRMHLMPNGLIASVGQTTQDRVYDPSTGRWFQPGYTTAYRHYGTSILLPLQNLATEKGRILACGGSPDATTNAVASAEIVEPSGTNSLTRRSVGSMASARKFLNPVILPTGEVAIFGGTGFGEDITTARLNPEVFYPDTETWNKNGIWPAATVPRAYHGLALLLHDGRVWTAGTTTTRTSLESRIEIFNPWYTSETRPSISTDATGGDYGGTITIPTPDAANITKVSLVKVSATTHHYNTDQRLIWLQLVSTTSSSVTVQSPINNKLAPPGMYLIHVLNGAGVPSIGRFVKIPGSPDNPPDTTPPGQVTGLTVTASTTNPATQLDLSWTANPATDGVNHYNVYRGTTANFPVNTATDTPLATPATNSYSNTGLTASTTYFYKVAAVDAAGNIGTLSTEASGTTASGTPTFVSIYKVTGSTGSSSYMKLFNGTGGLKRAGEIMTSSSVLLGNSVKKVVVILRKSGNPTGPVNVVVRKGAGDSIAITFGTIDATTLTTTTDQSFTLEAPSSYTFASNDKVLVEWASTAPSTDQVWVKRLSTANTALGFDGAKTKQSHFDTTYKTVDGNDLAGEWFKLT